MNYTYYILFTNNLSGRRFVFLFLSPSSPHPSDPPKGKTTMTEKLLLYGGALQQAGAVRMKGEQRATQSDFMEMEKARGISIR